MTGFELDEVGGGAILVMTRALALSLELEHFQASLMPVVFYTSARTLPHDAHDFGKDLCRSLDPVARAPSTRDVVTAGRPGIGRQRRPTRRGS
ncbi:MAG TPA: hypothetical protein VGX03_24875, partial [Candidatus Binatia bacterium]|nr:hypothetical protein [Candidatus Binatia bacterium]